MKKPDPKQNPELDFDAVLAPGREYFPVQYLARMWGYSDDHIQSLIDEGELKETIDFRSKNAKRSSRRVHRSSVIEFLNKRRTSQYKPESGQ